MINSECKFNLQVDDPRLKASREMIVGRNVNRPMQKLFLKFYEYLGTRSSSRALRVQAVEKGARSSSFHHVKLIESPADYKISKYLKLQDGRVDISRLDEFKFHIAMVFQAVEYSSSPLSLAPSRSFYLHLIFHILGFGRLQL